MKTLTIYTTNSPGLLNDANLYKSIFENYFNVIINIHKESKFTININTLSDISLYLENLPENIQIVKYKLNIFMPNYELFFNYKALKYIHICLCKTKITKQMFDIIIKNNKFLTISIYTKFSTMINKKFLDSNFIIKKDVNLFVSLAGKSPYKNTSYIVYTWIKNDGFLNIDKDIKLRITCTDKCLYNLMKKFEEVFKIKFDFNITDETYVYKNLILYNTNIKKLTESEYENLLVNANVAICPSSKEGYGHYINEARFFKTFIITVDYPPMNELVFNNKNGILLKKLDKKNTYTISNYPLYKIYPNVDELTEKIIYCIKNKNNLYEKSQLSRKLFDSDLQYFKNTLTNKVIPIINYILS
jgi:glycosyltransferase involved in cell wall biosynthesis